MLGDSASDLGCVVAPVVVVVRGVGGDGGFAGVGGCYYGSGCVCDCCSCVGIGFWLYWVDCGFASWSRSRYGWDCCGGLGVGCGCVGYLSCSFGSSGVVGVGVVDGGVVVGL